MTNYKKINFLKKCKKDKSIHSRTIYNFLVKDYNGELIHKVPNEFRNSFKDYNHLSIDGNLQIDENDYGYF
jgi:hypothetical protein